MIQDPSTRPRHPVGIDVLVLIVGAGLKHVISAVMFIILILSLLPLLVILFLLVVRILSAVMLAGILNVLGKDAL